jgi:hypothetical protein
MMRYEVSPEKHETQILHRRRERKIESQRLENLKKNLRSQMNRKTESRNIQAA